MTYYAAPHLSQYSYSSYTANYGCTWTAVANGIGATTGGRHTPSPDYIHSLLPRSQETDPNTPGWSIADACHAAARYGVGLINYTGKGWLDAVSKLEQGHYLVVQGDSDQFGNATCSGAFNGNHCIGINPQHRTYNGARQWWINDGICPKARWEYESVLRRYAQKLYFMVQFASFPTLVPKVGTSAPTPTPTSGGNVTIRYAAVTDTGSRMALAEGQRLYDHPGGSTVTRMSRSAAVRQIGLAGQVNGHAWRAVLVGTGVGYPDGKAHKTVLYVPASAGKVVNA